MSVHVGEVEGLGGDGQPQPISPDDLTQYHVAAEIANMTVLNVANECVVGRRVVDLCTAGDKMIADALTQVYKSGVDKGIAYPTCVSINNCIGNFSPLSSDTLVLSAGDVVKIELGVHINGHAAVVGHTAVVNPDPARPLIGPAADAICAAYYAMEVALRMVKPGASSSAIASALTQVGEAFGCRGVQGVVTSSSGRYVVDGPRVIAGCKEDMDEDFTLSENDVFVIDVAMTTGDGKPRDMGVRPTVYRRNENARYELKLKTARQFMGEVLKHTPVMPFALRAFGHDSKAALGVAEAAQHDLVLAYPVRFDKPGSTVARLKCTMLLLPTGPVRLTGCQATPYVHSERSISNQSLNSILTTAAPAAPKAPASQKKRKGKAKAVTGDAMDM